MIGGFLSTTPSRTDDELRSNAGNFNMQNKFGSGTQSICGGSSQGTASTYTTNVDGNAIASESDCKNKCIFEGRDSCNDLLYKSTGSSCIGYSGTCDQADVGGEVTSMIFEFQFHSQRTIDRLLLTKDEKCSWVIKSNSGAPTFMTDSESNSSMVDSSYELHYVEYGD